MNKVVLIGRLTRDPDLRYPSSNIPVANFTVAVNRNFTNQNGEREADFINVIVWRKQAENVKKYITKGSLVAVEGRIQTRNYEGSDGKRVYVTEVVADNVQFLETKAQSQNRATMTSNGQFAEMDAPIAQSFESTMPDMMSTGTTNIEEDNPFANFDSNIEISDDDLPF